MCGGAELWMLSPRPQDPITVFIRDTRDQQDGSVIIPIAEYGREYGRGRGEAWRGGDFRGGRVGGLRRWLPRKAPICVLYNGYNHYVTQCRLECSLLHCMC